MLFLVLLYLYVRTAGYSLQPGFLSSLPNLTSNQQQLKNQTAHVVIRTIVVSS